MIIQKEETQLKDKQQFICNAVKYTYGNYYCRLQYGDGVANSEGEVA